jgi:hypothetical protein
LILGAYGGGDRRQTFGSLSLPALRWGATQADVQQIYVLALQFGANARTLAEAGQGISELLGRDGRIAPCDAVQIVAAVHLGHFDPLTGGGLESGSQDLGDRAVASAGSGE